MMKTKRQKICLQILTKALITVVCGFGIMLRSLNEKGKAKGILFGGNFLILNPMIGAIAIVKLYNKICLSKISEDLYRVNGMMQSLKRTEVLKNLKGTSCRRF